MSESFTQFVVTRLLTVGVFIGATTSATLSRLIGIPPLSRSRPIQLQGWWGVTDDPADSEFLRIYLRDVDIDNVPDEASLRIKHVWAAAQNWAHVGTAGNAVQTLERVHHISFGGDKVENMTLGNRVQNYAWALRLHSGITSSFLFIGTFTAEIELVQRIWGNDAYTWNKDPDVLNGDGISEIDMDAS